MSAATAGAAPNAMAKAAAISTRIRSWVRRSTFPRRLLGLSLAPLEIDVEVHPRVQIEGVVFVAQNPWMNNDVLDAIGVKLPRGVRGNQRGHAAEKLHALRAAGQPLGLVVKRVELGEVEPGKVRDALVWTVQKVKEAAAFIVGCGVRKTPHLKLSGPTHLERVGKLLFEELDADAYRVHASLPKLVHLAVERRRVRRERKLERLPVRQISPSVSVAVDIAELVEQRLGARDVVGRVAFEVRIVSHDMRWNRLRGDLRLIEPDDVNLAVAVVRHVARAPQRDLVVGETADDRIVHVEVGVDDGRLDAPA